MDKKGNTQARRRPDHLKINKYKSCLNMII